MTRRLRSTGLLQTEPRFEKHAGLQAKARRCVLDLGFERGFILAVPGEDNREGAQQDIGGRVRTACGLPDS